MVAWIDEWCFYQSLGAAITQFSPPLSYLLYVYPSATHSLFLCVLCVGGHWVNAILFQFHAIFKQVNYVEPYKDWGQAEGQLPQLHRLLVVPLFCVFFSLLFTFLDSLSALPSFTFLSCSVVIFPAAPVVGGEFGDKRIGSGGVLGKPKARRRSTGLLRRAVII